MFLKTSKITGLLFNCAMNCALPQLLENIDALVVLEHANNLSSLDDDTVYANHERLKAIFTTHYGLDNTSCTWEKFNTFLNTHSFYAQEIMFAPVFRIFIAEMALQSGQYEEQDLWRIRDIQATGRYNPLGIKEVGELFYVPLAIGNVTLFERSADTYVERITGIKSTCTFPSWIRRNHPNFSMYFDGEHYERLPHHELAEPTARFIEEMDTLPRPLKAVHDILSSYQSAEKSSEGLGRLVTYVHHVLVLAEQINGAVPAISLASGHGFFNVPHRAKFTATCTQMIAVLGELKKAGKITPAEHDALGEQIRSLYNNPENHQQFLQTMQQCEQRVGGKFVAYCMLAAGYAAKICSLGYLGDTWILQAHQKLEHIKTLESFASEVEIFYKPTP